MALKTLFSNRIFCLLRVVVIPLFFGFALSCLASSSDAEPHWIRISSSHFSVLTDGGENKGREVAVRLEQMRTVFAQLLMKTRVNMPEPLDVIAFKTEQEYAQTAPIRDGQPMRTPAFFLAGEDRNYIVLNLLEDDPWRGITHEFAHLLLDHNYPQTQDWFDEGFAEYFSGLRLDNKQARIGGDPELSVARKQDFPGTQAESLNPPKSLSELLNSSVWLSISDLFTARHGRSNYQEGSHHTLFYAQSWIAMHYLLNKNKLSEAGTYFDLVENQKLPVEQAIQQAYGMTSTQIDQALKDYFHSLGPSFQTQTVPPSSGKPISGVSQFPLPVDNIGTSSLQVSLTDARALIAEMMARLPEHRQQGLQELNALIGQPVQSLDDLLGLFSAAEVEQLARDRTPMTDLFSLSLSRPLGERFEFDFEAYGTRYDATVASGDVAATPASGLERTFQVQLSGNSLAHANDLWALSARYQDGAFATRSYKAISTAE
jgi:hypothetical protein